MINVLFITGKDVSALLVVNCEWARWVFRVLPHSKPLEEYRWQLTYLIMSATGHPIPILVVISSAMGAGQLLDLYHLYTFFTGYFFDSFSKATAETAEPILMHDGSNDASQ